MEILVTLHRMTPKGQLVARADVEFSSEGKTVIMNGFRVIKSGSKEPWIAVPQFEWTTNNKRFFKDAIKMSADLHNLVCKAILNEYLKQ